MCGNVDKLKAHRLIPLTPPLFFHFTLLLSKFLGMYLYGLAAVRLRKDSKVLGSVVDPHWFLCSGSREPNHHTKADPDPDPGQTCRLKKLNFYIRNRVYFM
jgi:hypothetical protein